MGLKIREARERRGWSQEDLAKAAGTKQQNIDRIESGEVKHSRYLSAVLRALGMDEEDRLGLVPLVGMVGAGAEVFSIDDHAKGGGLEEVERPHGSTRSTVAVKVRGDSMRPAYKDGDLLYYDRQANGDLSHLIGADCVVKLVDGRCFVKELRQTKGNYWLYSHNGDHLMDIEIDWAAKVKWVLKA